MTLKPRVVDTIIIILSIRYSRGGGIEGRYFSNLEVPFRRRAKINLKYLKRILV
jgi:hypothetical protein